MKSRDLETFVNEIKNYNRNPLNNEVLKMLTDRKTNPILEIPEKSILYRARIVESSDRIDGKSPFFGFSSEDSFVPPRNKTKDMRANYKNIPYLYCSNVSYISIAEVKPRVGSKISVAEIEVLDNLIMFDLTIQNKPMELSQDKQDILNDLSDIFSKPITSEDDTLDYVPSQYISEYIKNLGYDGIIYKSVYDISLEKITSQPLSQKYNCVIFNYEKCKTKSSNLVQIQKINIECASLACTEKFDVKSPMDEALSFQFIDLLSGEY